MIWLRSLHVLSPTATPHADAKVMPHNTARYSTDELGWHCCPSSLEHRPYVCHL